MHEQNIPTVSKFSHLKSVLKESALSSIARIPSISENYELVTQLLVWEKSRLSVCQVTRVINSKFSEVQKTSETIEKLLRQLEAQGKISERSRQKYLKRFSMDHDLLQVLFTSGN